MTDQPGPTLYEVVSLYDSRIIRRDMTYAQADEWVRYLNRNAEHGAKMVAQR